MADLLALSWDRHRLTGIELSPAAAGPRVLGAFSVDWPEQPPTSVWLRETVKRFGVVKGSLRRKSGWRPRFKRRLTRLRSCSKSRGLSWCN